MKDGLIAIFNKSPERNHVRPALNQTYGIPIRRMFFVISEHLKFNTSAPVKISSNFELFLTGKDVCKGPTVSILPACTLISLPLVGVKF